MYAHRTEMLAIALLLATALGATACGSSSSGSSSSAQQTSNSSSAPSGATSTGKLHVTETEFKIAPDNPTIAETGTVTFTVANKGKFPHALEVEGVSGEPKTSTLQPGQTATLQVNFTKKGSFTWYCPVDGHRQKGMEGKITVGGGSASSGQGGGGY